MLADAQVARWQGKCGRDPIGQQRSWLVSKIRTDLAMREIKLNAPVMIKNLQSMLEKSLELEYPESRHPWADTTIFRKAVLMVELPPHDLT
jgi:hypothetical protein